MAGGYGKRYEEDWCNKIAKSAEDRAALATIAREAMIWVEEQ